MAPPVRVLLFASAREAVGRSVVTRAVPAEGVAMETFLEGLAAVYPRLRDVLRVSRVVQNGELLPRPRGRVVAGDTLAVYPPFSGG